MKTNYHTHSIWCDGQNTPEEMIQSAIGRGFGVLGFSSHSTYPEDDACTVPKAKLPGYFDEVRALAAKYAGRIRVLCGVEADYIPGVTDPDRRRYAQFRRKEPSQYHHYFDHCSAGRWRWYGRSVRW